MLGYKEAVPQARRTQTSCRTGVPRAAEGVIALLNSWGSQKALIQAVLLKGDVTVKDLLALQRSRFEDLSRVLPADVVHAVLQLCHCNSASALQLLQEKSALPELLNWASTCRAGSGACAGG